MGCSPPPLLPGNIPVLDHTLRRSNCLPSDPRASQHEVQGRDLIQ